MKKILLTNAQLLNLLSDEAYEKWSWSMTYVYIVCKNTGTYFQIDDFDDNTLLVTTTVEGLEKYILREV